MDVFYIPLLLVSLFLANVQSYNREVLDMYMHQIGGQATYYGKSQQGACQLGSDLPPVSQNIRYFVGVSAHQYKGSQSCGLCFRVHGSGQGLGKDPVAGEFVVMVNDVCPGCKEGDVDLADDGDGRWQIKMQAVQCPVEDTKIEYRMTGSGVWYLRLQIRNTRIPIQTVHVMRNGEEVAMTHSSDGYWQLGNGKLSPPLQIKLTGVTDEILYDTILSIVNDVVVQGGNGVQFSLDPNLPE